MSCDGETVGFEGAIHVREIASGNATRLVAVSASCRNTEQRKSRRDAAGLLVRAMGEAGLTQEPVAAALAVSRQIVGGKMDGSRPLTVADLIDLATSDGHVRRVPESIVGALYARFAARHAGASAASLPGIGLGIAKVTGELCGLLATGLTHETRSRVIVLCLEAKDQLCALEACVRRES